MAEAIATLGVVATILQIVDFGRKVLERLDEFEGTIRDSPQSLNHIRTELPLLFDTLKETEKAIAAGAVKEDTARALVPIVQGCQKELESLYAIFEKALPKEGASRAKRSLKAFSSVLTYDSKIKKLSSSIHQYIQTLTFYHSAATWTVQISSSM
jgi:N-terminal domain on NACHT_NTPase and P-loop NTPases